MPDNMCRATIAISGLVVSISGIYISFDHSPVFERPTQSSTIGLFFVGLFVLFIRNLIPKILTPSTPHDLQSKLQLQDQYLYKTLRHSSPKSSGQFQPLSPRISSLLITIAVVALCFRIEIYRLALGNRQCTISGIEGLLPFFIALYDCFFVPHWHRPSKKDKKSIWLRNISSAPVRYLLPTASISVASIITTYVADDVRSTYICPQYSVSWRIIPLLQILGTFLDLYVLISIDIIIRRKEDSSTSIDATVSLVVSSVLLLSAAFLFLGGIVAFITHPRYWKWILGIDATYIYGLSWHTSLFILATLCALNIYIIYGLLYLSIIITIVYMFLSGFKDYLSNKRNFLQRFQTLDLSSAILLFLGMASFLYVSSREKSGSLRSTKRPFYRIPSSSYLFLALLFILRCFIQLPQNGTVDHHPIDLLRHAAREQSRNWHAQATASKTLAEAAETYRQKYHRYPPPRFDIWYKFALNRSALVIDEYDNIQEDLKLFWAVHPTNIRYLTRKILSDQRNEVAEISIRSGKAEIGPRVRPTHRWMLGGVLQMLDGFVQWLPDMDLAFNINDESRIAIPWNDIQKLRSASSPKRIQNHGVFNEWSLNRTQAWRPLGDVETPKRCFKDRSSTNSFVTYGSISCPPDSPSRKSYLWDPRNLCFSCAAPHSVGLFLSNWSLSASPCHQPDLARLHGFYLSPGAFRPSHSLLPVFSQSKAHGYADIRYPSAWNYIDKVKYEPSDIYPDGPFTTKRNVLFWRGATSEGLSKHAAWKGMARQRLVHLANNATHPLPMLLPHPSQPTSYANRLVPASSIRPLGLNLDMGIVDLITRCWDWDCENQVSEFGLVNQTDFQSHWGYRYLFDLDGTGFSGRFLPFLQSRSLVFKTALFREWWDGRLIAWQHFVPIDIRFHGLLSTLAYFAGTAAGSAGGEEDRWAPMKPHLEEAEQIAEEGREWAAKVLRKEDMEVYMFRLLLEWGRLTDDRRDELGFSG